MRNGKMIWAVRSSVDQDRWSHAISGFWGSWLRESRCLISRLMKCEIVKWSEPSDQVLIEIVDPMPFRGFGDHELESRDASSPDSWNVKSWKHLMHTAVVTALGHINERWRKELEQPSSFSGIATGDVETHGHTNAELPNAEMPKWMQDPMESIQRCWWIWTRSEGYCSTT